MKRELAVRLTAIEDKDELRVAQVERILATFTQNLIICSMCDGSKHFTFADETTVYVRDDDPDSMATVRATAAGGQKIDCPACAGTGRDPKFSTWHCARNESRDHCETMQEAASKATKAEHADCGWRVMLPMDANGKLVLSPSK